MSRHWKDSALHRGGSQSWTAAGQRTALLTQLPFKVHSVAINCVHIADPRLFFRRLAVLLGCGGVPDPVSTLARILVPKSPLRSPMFLLMLDEIDQLLAGDAEALYTLFEWAATPTSRLVLVGIANASDLTTRLLPRLEAKNSTDSLTQSLHSSCSLRRTRLPRLPASSRRVSSRFGTTLKTNSNPHSHPSKHLKTNSIPHSPPSQTSKRSKTRTLDYPSSR